MKLIKTNDAAETGVSHNAKIRKRVWIENGEQSNITNYARAVFPPGEKAAAHDHDDMTEVFTCVSGCGEIRVNEVGYVFDAGTTVVVEAGEMHEIINAGTTDLVVSYFGVLVD